MERIKKKAGWEGGGQQKIMQQGRAAVSDALLMLATNPSSSSLLNRYYLDNICSKEAREMVHAHAVIHKGKVETLCYLTAAAVAWLLSGEDVAPPFSGVWEDADTEMPRHLGEHQEQEEGCCVVSFGDPCEEEDFESTISHVIVSLHGGCTVVDSDFEAGRILTVHRECSWPISASSTSGRRFIPFRMCEDGMQERLGLVMCSWADAK